jgi:putative ATPase
MKDLGYGRDYQYAHDRPEGVAAMSCLPEALAQRRYYRPTPRGVEPAIGQRLDAARAVRDAPEGERGE